MSAVLSSYLWLEWELQSITLILITLNIWGQIIRTHKRRSKELQLSFAIMWAGLTQLFWLKISDLLLHRAKNFLMFHFWVPWLTQLTQSISQEVEVKKKRLVRWWLLEIDKNWLRTRENMLHFWYSQRVEQLTVQAYISHLSSPFSL